MVKKNFFLLFLFLYILAGCSMRYTKQFIVPHEDDQKSAEPIRFNGWTVDPPGVIAYVNVEDPASVVNPNMYWLTIRSRYPLNGVNKDSLEFSIDSVEVTYFKLDSTYFTDSTITKNNKIYESPYFTKFITTTGDTIRDSIAPKILESYSEMYDVAHMDKLFLQDTTVWTSPTRTAPFIDNKGKYLHYAFDFYRDKGIEIPEYINKIELSFQAMMSSDGQKTKKTKKFDFILIRDDKSISTPFMIK